MVLHKTDPQRYLLALTALALLLAACGGAIPEILPDGEIQVQTREAQAEAQTLQAEPTEGELAAEEQGAAAEATSGEPPQAAASGILPAIVPGSPEFHASQVDSFAIASGRVQFVEFFAYWCAVCKAMAPTVHGLENLYGNQIAFVYLDRDDPNTVRFQEQLGYIYQPHFFLIDPGGVVLGQWRGYVEGMELQRALVAAIQ